MSASHFPLRLGLAISNEVPLAESVALAQRAERLGFPEVWIPESSHGRGAFAVATHVAAKTATIGIGIGIVNPFWRHPSVIAMEAATLDEASGGRVRLGIGAALWTLRALGEIDARADKPLSAMREALVITRSMLRGTAGIDATIFPARADGHLDFEPLRRDVPVYVGAVNAKMMELGGALADGVELGAITSPGYVRWSRERIEAGAAECRT